MQQQERLSVLPITDFTGKKILCVGDIILDRYIHGSVSRISPEAPVPILSQSKITYALGGAANVAHNIARLAGDVRLCSITGTGSVNLLELIEGTHGITPYIYHDKRPMTVKTRYMAGNQQLLRVDEEITTPITGRMEGYMIGACSSEVESCAVMIISDYGKGTVTHLARRMIMMARNNGVKSLVDPKGRSFSHYYGADVLTPNVKELAIASNVETLSSEEEIHSAALKQMHDYDIGAMVVTRGENGMMIVTRDEPYSYDALPSHAQEVIDVSGAGDTVIAVLALGLACGMHLTQAARYANAAAAVVIGKPMAATLTQTELMEAL